MPPRPMKMGCFSIRQASKLTGLTLPMVDYLCRTGVVVPTGNSVRGRGRSREYAFGDICVCEHRVSEARSRKLASSRPAPEDPSVAMMPNARRDQVFVSYSHKDKQWLDKLNEVLAPDIRNGRISYWDDRILQPGDPW